MENNDKVVELLSEIRDLHKQSLERYALINQRVEEAQKKNKKTIFWLALLLFAYVFAILVLK